MLIEDSPKNLIRTCAERVCFDQIWNRDDEKDYVYGIYRIHHWGEIINVFNEIERKSKEWERK